MSTGTNPTHHHQPARSVRSGPSARLRLADLWAGRVHLAVSAGAPHDLLGQEFPVPLDDWPRLQRILDEAGPVARSGDPTAVRVLRSPRGALSVVRLHTPAWSLVMSAGRPIPAVLLGFIDLYGLVDVSGDLVPLDLRDEDWYPEVAAMTDAVHTALPALTTHP